jgi:hypothetical protein
MIHSRLVRNWAIAAAFSSLIVPGHAQVEDRPSHIPTRQVPNSTFGTQWAKPNASGNSIYRDPDRPDPNGPRSSQRNKRCPAPSIYDPAAGGCR